MRSAYQAWKVPATGMPSGATNVQTAGLKADGATDNTAALQALLNAKAAGATLYFPAGTYRINGGVTITKPVTILGTTGTVFDCTRTSSNVFTVNKGGSLSSKMSGVTFTGIVIEGPGVETGPTMIDCYYLQGARFQYTKFRNVGYGAIRVKGCADVVVEDSVFDNVFRTGYGYGVVILDYSDNIVVRDNFFVTKGRHGVATGTATTGLPTAGYIKRVTVENNYFENFTDQAMDAHDETTGPYVARNNVVVNSRVGINTRNGLTELYDNVFVGCTSGILLRNQLVSASSIGAKVDRVVGNTILGAANGMQVDKTNSVIENNVMQGTGTAIYLGPTAYSPDSAQITGNVLENWSDGFATAGGTGGISLVNNWLSPGTGWQKVT
jgi:hypothetical protein